MYYAGFSIVCDGVAEFTPAQVHRMFGGSDFTGQLYQSTEAGTGPDVIWHYI